MAQRRDRGRRRVLTEYLGCRIPRHGVEQEERRRGDADHDDQRRRDTPGGVAARERQLSQTFSSRYAPPGLTAKPLTFVLVA